MKKTINKTEELKNNLNRVGDNINKKLVNKANNLSEIAQKIEEEIQEYTKIASGVLNKNVDIQEETKIQIALPIDFNPRYIILAFKSIGLSKFIVEDGVANSVPFTIFTGSTALNDLKVSFKTVKMGEYILSILTNRVGAKVIITDWVAIG